MNIITYVSVNSTCAQEGVAQSSSLAPQCSVFPSYIRALVDRVTCRKNLLKSTCVQEGVDQSSSLAPQCSVFPSYIRALVDRVTCRKNLLKSTCAQEGGAHS